MKLNKLTKRELEVLELLVQNCSNTQIAEILIISRSTVKAHVSNILEKLEVNGRTHLAFVAGKYGLVDN